MLISSWTWWGNNHYQHAHLLDGNRSFDQILYNGKTREEVSEISSNFLFCAFLFLLHVCIIIFLQSSDRKWIHLLPFDFKYRPLLINAMLATYYYTLHNFQRFFWIDVSYDLHIGVYFVPKKVQNWKVLDLHTKKMQNFQKRVNLVFQLPPSKYFLGRNFLITVHHIDP